MTAQTPFNKHLQRTAGESSRRLGDRLLRNFRALELPTGTLVVVGFSGGVDSLCLGLMLHRISAYGGFEVHLVHVDHGIREESANDAARAERCAEELNLPITVVKLERNLVERTAGLGLEEAARRERYLAFANTCRDLHTNVIALAHHEQDQAESVLLHLLRGAGLQGAAAMSQIADVNVPWWEADGNYGLKCWRPLLDEPKSAIDAVVAESGLSPIKDESNDDRRFFRNWLRHDALPGIDVRNPGSSKNLARYASIAAEEDSFLRLIAERALSQSVDPVGRLNWVQIETDPPAIQRRVVKMWLSRLLPHLDVSFDRLEAVRSFGDRMRPDSQIQLGGGAVVVWRRNSLVAGTREAVLRSLRADFDGPLAPVGFSSINLQSGGGMDIDGWRIVNDGDETLTIRTSSSGERLVGSNLALREWARAHSLHPLLRDRMLVADSSLGPVWAAARRLESVTVPASGSGQWRHRVWKTEAIG